jgi:hypothetical protein
MCVLISLALSAYLSVLVVCWYWSLLEDTVAIIAVRELPLRPSFKRRVNLLRTEEGASVLDAVLIN